MGPARQNNRYLYLAIACFLGLVAVFVFAGYLGVLDTVFVRTGEYEQKIDAQFWRTSEGRYPYSVGAAWEETIGFRYEVNNRRFSAYGATVEVSLWRSNEKLLTLVHKDISLAAFESATLEWSLTPETLERAGLQIGQYTVKIVRGGAELGQGIVIGYHTAYPPKSPVPAPPYPPKSPIPVPPG